MCGTAQRLPGGSVVCREDLGNKDPDHRALADCVRGDKCKARVWNYGKVLCEKSPGTDPKRRDVADGSNIEQRATPQSIDEIEANEGKDEIGYANANRL